VSELLDAIVIGAGWAGIAAARDLNDRGHRVLILEASDHLGGRTVGEAIPGLESLHADLGGAWINRGMQPLMRGEVARYGIAIKEDKPTENAVFRTGGVTRSLPVPVAQLADLDRAMSHLEPASRRVIPSRPLTAQALGDLDITADEFFAPLNLPLETQEFVYSMLSVYTGAHLSKCSMLQLIAQTAAYGHSALGFYTCLTERFVRGPESLLQEMVDRGRLDLRLSHNVVSVQQSADSVTVRTEGGGRFDARTCVVAIPSNVMKNIEYGPQLSREKAAVLAEDHLGRCYKSIILVSNLPAHPFAVGSSALQALVGATQINADTYLLTGFGAEGIMHLDPADRDQVQKAVRTYFPGAEVVAVQSKSWNDDPLFNGTWRWDRGGEALPFLSAMSTPEGRVVFAGTDLDDSVWRTWMEGALNDAKRAVDLVSNQLHDDKVSAAQAL